MDRPRLRSLDLFSGIGGLTLALEPWAEPVAYCENDPYAQAVLLSRMHSGELPRAPIWDDVKTLRGDVLPTVDLVVGGFPCTDVSDASRGRGAGLDGESSGLWYEMLRLVEELRPGNVLRASAVGAPFKGDRIFVAAADREGKPAFTLNAEVALLLQPSEAGWRDWGEPPPRALGVANGLPDDVDRLRCLGNSVVPAQAREAFRRLSGL
jgi:hypothetical protein